MKVIETEDEFIIVDSIHKCMDWLEDNYRRIHEDASLHPNEAIASVDGLRYVRSIKHVRRSTCEDGDFIQVAIIIEVTKAVEGLMV